MGVSRSTAWVTAATPDTAAARCGRACMAHGQGGRHNGSAGYTPIRMQPGDGLTGSRHGGRSTRCMVAAQGKLHSTACCSNRHEALTTPSTRGRLAGCASGPCAARPWLPRPSLSYLRAGNTASSGPLAGEQGAAGQDGRHNSNAAAAHSTESRPQHGQPWAATHPLLPPSAPSPPPPSRVSSASAALSGSACRCWLGGGGQQAPSTACAWQLDGAWKRTSRTETFIHLCLIYHEKRPPSRPHLHAIRGARRRALLAPPPGSVLAGCGSCCAAVCGGLAVLVPRLVGAVAAAAAAAAGPRVHRLDQLLAQPQVVVGGGAHAVHTLEHLLQQAGWVGGWVGGWTHMLVKTNQMGDMPAHHLHRPSGMPAVSTQTPALTLPPPQCSLACSSRCAILLMRRTACRTLSTPKNLYTAGSGGVGC